MCRSVCQSACFAYSPPWLFLTASHCLTNSQLGRISKNIKRDPSFKGGGWNKLFSVHLDNFWFSIISLNPLHRNFNYLWLGVEKNEKVGVEKGGGGQRYIFNFGIVDLKKIAKKGTRNERK